MLVNSERGKNYPGGYDSNKENLFSLASRASVTAEVELDVLRADRAAKVLKEDFVQNRLGYASTKYFSICWNN